MNRGWRSLEDKDQCFLICSLDPFDTRNQMFIRESADHLVPQKMTSLSEHLDYSRIQARKERVLRDRAIWWHLHLWGHKEHHDVRALPGSRGLCLVGFLPPDGEDPRAACQGALERNSTFCRAVQHSGPVLRLGEAQDCCHGRWPRWWTVLTIPIR